MAELEAEIESFSAADNGHAPQGATHA